MATESAQWRKFLHPVITGLVALMAAGVGYLQHLQKQDGNKLESRTAAIEVQVQEIQPWRNKVDNLLLDIRSDVSFIRGKMEVGGVGFGK